jgi:hypothetical protein
LGVGGCTGENTKGKEKGGFFDVIHIKFLVKMFLKIDGKQLK